VLVSDPKGRDIKIDAYTLSFHGRLLVEGAEITLNYGQRYGLLGDNGSGKVCLEPIQSGITVSLAAVSRHSCSPSPNKIFLSHLI
jgi:ABC-type hemin transport system ATPase subunit